MVQWWTASRTRRSEVERRLRSLLQPALDLGNRIEPDLALPDHPQLGSDPRLEGRQADPKSLGGLGPSERQSRDGSCGL